jgi:hypothetical protein
MIVGAYLGFRPVGVDGAQQAFPREKSAMRAGGSRLRKDDAVGRGYLAARGRRAPRGAARDRSSRNVTSLK